MMAQTNIKIALIGLDQLSSVAVSDILKEYSEHIFLCLNTPEDTLAYSGTDWFFIVSPLTVVEHFDFFIPRKQKTLVISNMPCKNISGGMSVVSARDNYTTIVAAINHFLDEENNPSLQIQSLSSREIEVLRLIAKGLTIKEIADVLFISVNTVNSHRKNITSKLGIRSASALSLYALMNGII